MGSVLEAIEESAPRDPSKTFVFYNAGTSQISSSRTGGGEEEDEEGELIDKIQLTGEEPSDRMLLKRLSLESEN